MDALYASDLKPTKVLEATPFQDKKQATDLVAERPGMGRTSLGMRIRRAKMGRISRPDYFTLRDYNHDHDTEYHKVMRGHMHFLFYGHENPDMPNVLGEWLLLDMIVFRRHERHSWRSQGNSLGLSYKNKDRSGRLDGTGYREFSLDKFPPVHFVRDASPRFKKKLLPFNT